MIGSQLPRVVPQPFIAKQQKDRKKKEIEVLHVRTVFRSPLSLLTPPPSPLPLSLHQQTALTETERAPKNLYTYFASSAIFYRNNVGALRQEIISGFTIAILQIPESVAFAFVAGLDPIIGLRATVFMGFFCGLTGARPGMVSGAAGAMAVILAEVSGPGGKWVDRPKAEVEDLVFMTIILTGAIQAGLGILGVPRFSKLIPFTAMIGFMNGLAIIILISQLNAFKECPGQEYSVCARADTLQWMTFKQGRLWMALLETALAAACVALFPRFQRLKRYVPAALVALVVVTIFEHTINRLAIDLPTRTVDETAPVSGEFVAPRIPVLPKDAPWGEIAQYAVIMAFVGAIESILTAEAVAELLQEPSSKWASTQETLSQGLGNFISGLFGSMGGDAMIGQSTVNVLNGARGRLSTTSSAVFLLVIILALSPAIDLVPVSCLTGILFIIVIKTFHWPTFLLLFQLSWPDSLAIIMVTVLAVTTNLAIAVGAGIVWNALVHAYATTTLLRMETVLLDAEGKPVSAEAAADAAQHEAAIRDDIAAWDEQQARQAKSRRKAAKAQRKAAKRAAKKGTGSNGHANGSEVSEGIPRTADDLPMRDLVDIENGSGGAGANDRPKSPTPLVREKRYYVEGPLFFGSAQTFRTSFLPLSDPEHIVIDFTESLVADFSGVTAIRGVCKRYRQEGKRVTVKGLGQHSRVHVSRNVKLRHYAEASERAEAEGDDRGGRRGDEDRQHMLLADGGDATTAPGTATAPGLQRLFQPQGDSVTYSEDLAPEDVVRELRRGGVEVEEDHEDQTTLRRRNVPGEALPEHNGVSETTSVASGTDTFVV
jgi:MFS superfamily sulfate permease-like transporter